MFMKNMRPVFNSMGTKTDIQKKRTLASKVVCVRTKTLALEHTSKTTANSVHIGCEQK